MTPEPDQRPLDESLYRVLILNDNETPMEFVVDLMERFFGKDYEAHSVPCFTSTTTAWGLRRELSL